MKKFRPYSAVLGGGLSFLSKAWIGSLRRKSSMSSSNFFSEYFLQVRGCKNIWNTWHRLDNEVEEFALLEAESFLEEVLVFEEILSSKLWRNCVVGTLGGSRICLDDNIWTIEGSTRCLGSTCIFSHLLCISEGKTCELSDFPYALTDDSSLFFLTRLLNTSS